MIDGRGEEPDDVGGLTPRPTLYDVADRAGVSHQTVSRLLKGEGIRAHNRVRIEKAISQLGYRPNQAARTLAKSRGTRIGALVGALGVDGPSRVVLGAGEAAREAGYILDIVSVPDADAQHIDAAFALLDGGDLIGALAFSPPDPIMDALTRRSFSVPVLLAHEASEPVDGTTEPTANRVAVELAVGHLAALGHREILHVTGPSDWVSSRNREWAFSAAIRRAGISGTTVAGDWTAQSGFDVVAALPSVPSAVLAANDLAALGVITALTRRGLRVPADVSVVGIDDIPEAPFIGPGLTSIALPFEEYGREALLDLLTQIEGRPASTFTPRQPRLVVRESTAPAR